MGEKKSRYTSCVNPFKALDKIRVKIFQLGSVKKKKKSKDQNVAIT